MPPAAVTTPSSSAPDAAVAGGGMIAGDDGTVANRLPGRGRGGHGHGVHRRADRPRRCARHARRPPLQRRRPLARRLPLRPAPPGVALLRRGVDGARRRRSPTSGSRGGTPGARPPIRDPGVLRRHPPPPLPPLGPGHLPRRQRVSPRRDQPSRHVPRLGCDGERRRQAPGRRRHLSRADDPLDNAPAVPNR